MPESLAGKVAVVTGGGSGIGAAVVHALTGAGVNCHAVGRRGPVKLDVSDQRAVQALVDSLERLDILVCAAADQVLLEMLYISTAFESAVLPVTPLMT